jgi:hypothetical protein
VLLSKGGLARCSEMSSRTKQPAHPQLQPPPTPELISHSSRRPLHHHAAETISVLTAHSYLLADQVTTVESAAPGAHTIYVMALSQLFELPRPRVRALTAWN